MATFSLRGRIQSVSSPPIPNQMGTTDLIVILKMQLPDRFYDITVSGDIIPPAAQTVTATQIMSTTTPAMQVCPSANGLEFVVTMPVVADPVKIARMAYVFQLVYVALQQLVVDVGTNVTASTVCARWMATPTTVVLSDTASLAPGSSELFAKPGNVEETVVVEWVAAPAGTVDLQMQMASHPAAPPLAAVSEPEPYPTVSEPTPEPADDDLPPVVPVTTQPVFTPRQPPATLTANSSAYALHMAYLA